MPAWCAGLRKAPAFARRRPSQGAGLRKTPAFARRRPSLDDRPPSDRRGVHRASPHFHPDRKRWASPVIAKGEDMASIRFQRLAKAA